MHPITHPTQAGVRQIEQTSNAEEKHFDQEQSNVLKKISASPTSQESGLRFKKLDEITSFWGKVTPLPCPVCIDKYGSWRGHTSLFCALPPMQDDDGDHKDSEYSTDDVDTEEESQILVPISRGKGSECCVDDPSNGFTCIWFCR